MEVWVRFMEVWIHGGFGAGGHPGGPRASPIPRENTMKICRFDPRTRTFSKSTPHRPLGRNFHPTAPGGVPSANPAPFLRNRSKSRGTAFRAPARNAHESVGRTVRPTAPWGVPSSYAFSTRIGAPRPRIPRVSPRIPKNRPPGGSKAPDFRGSRSAKRHGETRIRPHFGTLFQPCLSTLRSN